MPAHGPGPPQHGGGRHRCLCHCPQYRLGTQNHPLQEPGIWENCPFPYSFGRTGADRIMVTRMYPVRGGPFPSQIEDPPPGWRTVFCREGSDNRCHDDHCCNGRRDQPAPIKNCKGNGKLPPADGISPDLRPGRADPWITTRLLSRNQLADDRKDADSSDHNQFSPRKDQWSRQKIQRKQQEKRP